MISQIILSSFHVKSRGCILNPPYNHIESSQCILKLISIVFPVTLVGAEVAESSRPMCAAFPRLTTSYKQDLFAKSKDKHRLLN